MNAYLWHQAGELPDREEDDGCWKENMKAPFRCDDRECGWYGTCADLREDGGCPRCGDTVEPL